MAKKIPKDQTMPSFSTLLGPAGIDGFLNPDDPKLKRKRERASKLVVKEFAKILAGFHAVEEAKDEEKKRAKLVRKLAESGESP